MQRFLFVTIIVFGFSFALPLAAADDHDHDHHGHNHDHHRDMDTENDDHDSHDHHGDHHGDHPAEENRTRIAADMAAEAGVRTATAGPARIRQTMMLYGTVRPDEERVLRLTAPYAGRAREVRVSVGDGVTRGDVLAMIESSESLASYTLKAPRNGLIISRHINPGELSDDEPLFVLADLSQVWIDFAAFPGQHSALQIGQPVIVHGSDNRHAGQARLGYIAPIGSSASQSVLVRAILDNRDGHWLPGLLVTGDVVIADSEVPLAVKVSALQTFNGETVVFARNGEVYEARPLRLGRRDEQYVEVLSGLEAGVEYVTDNSYLIKADILKESAGHGHHH